MRTQRREIWVWRATKKVPRALSLRTLKLFTSNRSLLVLPHKINNFASPRWTRLSPLAAVYTVELSSSNQLWGQESRPRSFYSKLVLWLVRCLMIILTWILQVASSERETTKENKSYKWIRMRWLLSSLLPLCLHLNLKLSSKRESQRSVLRVRFAWKAAIMPFIKNQETTWVSKERTKTTAKLCPRPLHHHPHTKWPLGVLAREHASNDFYLVCF